MPECCQDKYIKRMAVKLSFEENTQVIRINGTLTQAESDAVKLKIQEKYNQGRYMFLFDLTEFVVSDEGSTTALKPLMRYCLDLNASYIYSGVAKEFQKNISIPNEPTPVTFSTRAEALQFAANHKHLVTMDKDESGILEKKIKTLIGRYESTFRVSYRGPTDLTVLLHSFLEPLYSEY